MEIKIGQKVLLMHNQSACNRTKNLIREHGSKGFVIEMFVPASSHFGGAPAICFRSVSKLSNCATGGKECWRGWLPIGEFIMSDGVNDA